MRAIVFVEKGKVETWDDLEAAEPGQDEVQLETLYTGITVGTERHGLLQGPYSMPFPVIPGYQNVGRITKLGEGVTGFNVGDIIFSDGGSKPVNYDGSCWGGHLEVRNRVPKWNFLKIPESVQLEDAAFLGVMGIGMKAAKRGQVSIHSRVLVVGLGLIGQACARASLAMGADVEAVDLMPERRTLAEAVGCSRVWDGGRTDVWDEIREGGGYDVVFETTGAAEMPDNALRSLVPTSGRMVAIGGKFEMKYDNLGSGQNYEATIIHTSHFGLEDLQDLVRLLADGRIRVNDMITHRAEPEQAPEIYSRIVEDPSGLLGVVFKWQ